MLSVQKNNLNLMERVGSLKNENHRLKHLLNDHGIEFKSPFIQSTSFPLEDPHFSDSIEEIKSNSQQSLQLPLINDNSNESLINDTIPDPTNNLVKIEN